MKRYCYLILFFFSFLHSKAIDPPYLYYLGIESGLSNNAVTSIYQDRYGFMWFGTYEGLNRYDGYKFQLFKNDPNDQFSLPDNRIVAIQEDTRHNIIVGTKKGLSLYESRTGKFRMIQFQNNGKNETASHAVNDLARDKAGNVYIATDGQGLLIYGADSQLATSIFYTEGEERSNRYPVLSVKIDHKDNVWLYIQGKGLCRYEPTSKRIIPVNKLHMNVTCMEPDQLGNIWIGNESGLYKYEIASKKLYSYRDRGNTLFSANIFDLQVDKANRLWIGTDGDGIGIYNLIDESSDYLRPGKEAGLLTSGAVNTIFQDKDQRMWIGTLRGGINVIDQHRARFKTMTSNPLKPNQLISNFILSFCEDEHGNVWVGTDGEGLSYWNRKNGNFNSYSHKSSDPGSLSNNNVAGILRDKDNNIWLATYGGGINKFNESKGNFSHYACFNEKSRITDRNTWSIYQDKQNNIWVGTCTDGGTYKFNRQLDKFELFDAGLKNVITIREDRQGVLWMGTFSSLIRIDPTGRNHKVFKMNAAVRAIYEDKKGNFWIGTEGAGLLRFDRKTGRSEVLTQRDGLSGNSILNILEDEPGNLWISTFSGLSRLSPSSKQIKNFHETDGLQSKQFNYNAALKLASGEFLFGGIKGFNLFRPEQIESHVLKPQLLITGLRINNIPYEQDEDFEEKENIYDTQKITLPYDKAVLSIDFAALEYSSPNKIAYAYFLEGWDENWNESGNNRTINYSRLREGNYTLRIKSTDAEGKWLNNERILLVKVLPPWWRSYWAYLFYVTVAASLIYIYLNYQKRQTTLKYQVDLANLKVAQEQELNEKKLAFFTNVSHEFRTPLTLIINPLKELLNNSGQVDSKELTVVYRNARRLLSLVDQLLLFRKSDADNLKIVKTDLVVFCKEVYFCFSQQARARKINFTFSSSAEHIDLYIDKEKIEIALFNLIANAFKFTPDGGVIGISIEETADEVSIHITDTGIGIPKEVGTKLFDRFYQVFEQNPGAKTGFGIGLYLVNKFISLHSGQVSYSSNPGEGTDFLVKLSKGKTQFSNHVIYEDVNESPVFINELIAEPHETEAVASENGLTDDFTTDKPGILVVDDNEEIRKYIKQLFATKYTVYEAKCGEEGLLMVRQHMPDIVVTDVVMQELSGVELCTKIKEDPTLSHIPVILLTSSSSPEIKLKGIEGGADDYITKPFDKDMLLARVANLLKSKNTLQNYFYDKITLKSDNSKVSQENKDFLEKCISITERNLNNPDFSIKTLADEIGMSHSALYKKVKAISGKTINEFIRYIKLRNAAQLFINTEHNVNEVALESGFTDIKYFREQFQKLFGLRPSEYIKKYRKSFGKGYKLS